MKFYSLLVFILIFAPSVFGASPPLSEAASRESKADPVVVKEDVDKMKEDVIDKKTQMKLLRQLIKAEAIESSFPILKITHLNEMSSRYRIYSMSYTIDQDRIYTYYFEDNQGKQALGHEIGIFKSPLVPGAHELTIDIVYKGNDTGVFSYINDYKIPSQLKKPFELKKGQNLDIEVVGYEKGWALTDFKDRPELKIKFYSPNTTKELK